MLGIRYDLVYSFILGAGISTSDAVAKRGSSWILHYVKSAYATTDVPDRVWQSFNCSIFPNNVP